MRNSTITALAALLLIASTGCKSEIDGKTAATVTESSQTAAATENADPTAEKAAAPTTVDLNLDETKIEWVGAKVTGDHQGGFKTFTGTASYGPDGELVAVQTEIDTTSVYSDVEKLTGHLKSADFFDVESHPKASFVSKEIVKQPDGTYTIVGDLDLRGVKKEISFPATIEKVGSNTVATAEFTLQRFDFNIAYKGKPDDLIDPKVLMKLKVVAPTPADS